MAFDAGPDGTCLPENDRRRHRVRLDPRVKPEDDCARGERLSHKQPLSDVKTCIAELFGSSTHRGVILGLDPRIHRQAFCTHGTTFLRHHQSNTRHAARPLPRALVNVPCCGLRTGAWRDRRRLRRYPLRVPKGAGHVTSPRQNGERVRVRGRRQCRKAGRNANMHLAPRP